MRLQKQLDLIERALPIIANFKLTQNGNQFEAEGKAALSDALKSLLQVKYLEKHVGPLLSLPTFQFSDDKVIVPAANPASFDTPRAELVRLLTALKTGLSYAVPRVPEHAIAFRLPDSKAPDELEKVLHDVDIILKTVVLKYTGVDADKKKIEIIGFDTGSKWLVITVGAAAVVTVVGYFAQASGYVAQERRRWAQVESDAKVLEARGELAQTFAKGTEQLTELLVKQQAEILNKGHYDGSPEQQVALVNAIKQMADLFDRNATLELAKLPPVTQPPDAPKFPDLAKQVSGVPEPKKLPPVAEK